MSATVPESLLDTVDNPAPGPDEIVAIDPAERTGELAERLDAARSVRRLGAERGDYLAVARAVADLHRPGTLTLAVLNTVMAAREVHKVLRGGSVPCILLHSRFRAGERTELVQRISEPPGEAGQIVVATQVVEAGIDLNAAVLVTEAARWPSVVQRAGRCNRTGRIEAAGSRRSPAGSIAVTAGRCTGVSYPCSPSAFWRAPLRRCWRERVPHRADLCSRQSWTGSTLADLAAVS